jgi:hypothetical protein
MLNMLLFVPYTVIMDNNCTAIKPEINYYDHELEYFIAAFANTFLSFRISLGYGDHWIRKWIQGSKILDFDLRILIE